MTPPDRIQTLDAVRGVAVKGILLMNILAFAMPQQAYFQPRARGGSTGADAWAWAIAFVLVEGKMRGLFSLLFGASMLLVIEGAERAGQSGRRVHMLRMVWLLVFGLVHYWLIWFGDILTLYALVGMAAMMFTTKSGDELVKWAIGLFIASFVVWGAIMGGALFLEVAAARPDAPADMKKAFVEMMAAFGEPGSPDIAREVAAYRGSYADAIAQRGKDGIAGPFFMVIVGFVETLGLMLLGMAMLRNGFLRGDWDAADYRSFAIKAYAVGLPLSIAAAAWLWISGFDTLQLALSGFAIGTPVRLAMMLGHAALIVLLVKRAAHSRFVARIAAVGRAAFTNYLGTSVLMTLLFYGYGFGWFGHLSRWQVYLVPPVVFAIMLLWSKPWLDRYRFGPLEWLWRSLARGQMQAMRK